MDNKALRALKDELINLPRLNQKLTNTLIDLDRTKIEVKEALKALEKESTDVEALKKENLITTILKLINKYEGKLEKETQEFLQTKLVYECAYQKQEVLQQDYEQLKKQIEELEKQENSYKDEIEKRGNLLLCSLSSALGMEYRKLETQRNETMIYLNEIKEALVAAEAVKTVSETVKGHLDKADDWAHYDIWCNNSMLADIAKYDHIDDAKREFKKLFSALCRLQKEMKDIGYDLTIDEIGINSTTRTVDIWLDNIFTDITVRNKIEGDLEKIMGLERKIDHIITELREKKNILRKKLSVISTEQEEIALEF